MTLLARGEFFVDVPDGTTELEVEQVVAHAIAWYHNSLGLPGNSTVTCLSLTPEATVVNPTSCKPNYE